MAPPTYPSVANIDFAELYRQHMAATGRPKPASVWDARAEALPARGGDTRYTQAFLAQMDFTGCDSLLDVGCGTGTIALAAAPRLRRVVGLDYSARMLDRFEEGARELPDGCEARTILRSWDEPWDDVPECDIVVASRSTAVVDMADALRRLHGKARKRVYLTSMVGGHFNDVAVHRLLGRPVPEAVPDYIYIVHILYAMGIHPCVTYLDGASGVVVRDLAEACAQAEARVGALSDQERATLQAWWSAQPAGAAVLTPGTRWALISWDKAEAR